MQYQLQLVRATFDQKVVGNRCKAWIDPTVNDYGESKSESGLVWMNLIHGPWSAEGHKPVAWKKIDVWTLLTLSMH